MQHIEQVTINGTTHHLFNTQDLISLIDAQMGSQIASLVSSELSEANQGKEEALLGADAAYKELEFRTDELQAALEDVQEPLQRMSTLLEAPRLNRSKLIYIVRDIREIIGNTL